MSFVVSDFPPSDRLLFLCAGLLLRGSVCGLGEDLVGSGKCDSEFMFLRGEQGIGALAGRMLGGLS
jgi:hypothetical protein